jgi:cytochrome P450 PksS
VTSPAQKVALNPVSPENLLDPVQVYRDLRNEDPVHWSDLVHAWFVTRYTDVMNCFRDPRLTGDRARLFEFQLQGASPDLIQDFMRNLRLQMGMKDGREHLRLRRLANPGFTPQAIDSWRPAIRRTVAALLDRVQHQGHMDLVKEISHQLAPLTIAEIFGVPTKDREQFQSWAEPHAKLASPPAGTDMVELANQANRATQELREYLLKIIAERRLAPGDDVLSMMIHAQAGGVMTEDELVANANLIISAGHVTTTDLLSNTMHELLTHPEQLQMLRDDMTLVKNAVEEVLRYRPPLPFFVRIASETFQLHGRTIKQGDVVFLGMAAANRDPSVFPDPDRFDIKRDFSQHKHLSFGFGAHHCLGSGLARRELEIAIEELLQRMPGLRLDEEKPATVKCSSLFFRGFESLPVRW